VLTDNYLKHHVVCSDISIPAVSFISTEYRFLQARCQIIVSRLVRIGETLSRSIDSDIHIDFTSQVPYFMIAIGNYFIQNYCHPVELWIFQNVIEFDREDR
jgi:hypothetical protein